MRSWMIAFLTGWLSAMLTGHLWHQYFSPAKFAWAMVLCLTPLGVIRFSTKGAGLLALIFLGGLVGFSTLYQAAHKLPSTLDGTLLEIEGRLCDSPPSSLQSPQRVQSVEFCLTRVLGAVPVIEAAQDAGRDDADKTAPHGTENLRRLRLSCYYCPELLEPQYIYRLTAKIKLKRPLQNFHDWWPWQNQWSKPWDAKGSVRKMLTKTPGDEDVDSAGGYKAQVQATIKRTYSNLPNQGSISALLLGDRSGLSDAEWNTLRDSGLTHLLVISGLHISLVVGALFWVASRLFRPFALKHRTIAAAVLSATGVAAYVSLIEYGIPSLRAALAALLVLLAAQMRWRLLPSSWLLLVFLGCCLLDPFAVFGRGFWLSFGGVTVLLLLFGGKPFSRPVKIASLWKSQVGFFVGFCGVLLLFFQAIPMGAIIANLIAVPLICFVALPGAILSALMGMLSTDYGQLGFGLVDRVLALFWTIAETSAGFPVFQFSGDLALAGGLLGILSLLALMSFRIPMVFWLVPVVVGMGFCFHPRSESAFYLEMMDVGQGGAILIHSPDASLLYDVGPRYERWDAGDNVIVPALKRAGINQLKAVVVSHGDMDHAGGLEAVMAKVPAQSVLTGEPERVPLGSRCLPGIREYGGLKVEILWPLSPQTSSNDSSCVIRVAYESLTILLTGDIEQQAQRELIRHYGDDLRADVLTLPHHGSRNAFLPEFLSVVDPEIALVSAGYKNPFGHPHPIFSQWLTARQVPVLSTAEVGAIRIMEGGETVTGSAKTWKVRVAADAKAQYSFVTKP